MSFEWLLENASAPIKYILTKEDKYVPEVLENFEVKYWLTRLKERSDNKDLSSIHGSHDYRYENIMGKCAILGLSQNCAAFDFDKNAKFILDFLNAHIKNKNTENEPLSFGKIYSYRDYETILACFLPELGYQNNPAVRYIAEKRINIAYNFTKQKRYDIYIDSSKLKGVKKEWHPYIINPELYYDGNIALPSVHDYILFSGIYKYLDKDLQEKVENIVEWLLDEEYRKLKRRYGYFYAEGGAYNTKSILMTIFFPDIENPGSGSVPELLYIIYILSRFKFSIKSNWFKMALSYLDDFKTSYNTYIFPKEMITEKSDNYVINGGHMNLGENKKSKKYYEILSTYWMYRINKNLD